MACGPQLDVARRSRDRQLIARLALLLTLLGMAGIPAAAQEPAASSDAARLTAARAAFEARRWEEAAKLAQGPSDQSADLDFLAGLAFSRLESWKEARGAFEAGHRKSPSDARFLVELAGVAYKQKDFG